MKTNQDALILVVVFTAQRGKVRKIMSESSEEMLRV
jgi:hypothetical protein